MSKNKRFVVQGNTINLTDGGLISLTDMVLNNGGNDRIQNWIRNRDTLEFLGAWETMHNENFNSVEFHRIMYEAGSQRYIISVAQWVEKTNAIGIVSRAGRNGGTYAHNDIAINLANHLSPTFYLYFIKEFQRLKEAESNQYNLEWNVKRILSKVNYKLHTDAIKNVIIPTLSIAKDKQWLEYAREADLINVAVFGSTALMWNQANPARALKGENMRDSASINELAVLSNIESLNSVMIAEGISKKDRFYKLKSIAKQQLESLGNEDFIKSIKYTSENTYPVALEQAKESEKKSEFDTNLKGILAAGKPPKDGDK